MKLLTGNDLHSIAHPIFPGIITCDVNRCELAVAIRDERPHENVEDTFFRSDGRSFPVEFSLARMQESDGTARGAVMTFRDVTGAVLYTPSSVVLRGARAPLAYY